MLDTVESRVGQVIKGKWRVDSLLGTGGMAAVYAATHRNGNRIALKVLHLPLSVDAGLCRRFKREGYAANAVNHPGVVRVLDDDVTEDGAAFLVMELLEGETAAMRAERLGGRLPLQDVLAIMDGVLDVLAAAHAAGVVHRDIKPENIFFTDERVVKVLDFGIARLQSGSNAHATAAAMGTPAFMPPEQALGRMDQVDQLSDVWAAGATMYTLLSGRLVHELETANEVLIAAATRPAGSLAHAAPDVPLEIVEVVDCALAFDKASRWSSARAMQRQLRQAGMLISAPWQLPYVRGPDASSGQMPALQPPPVPPPGAPSSAGSIAALGGSGARSSGAVPIAPYGTSPYASQPIARQSVPQSASSDGSLPGAPPTTTGTGLEVNAQPRRRATVVAVALGLLATTIIGGAGFVAHRRGLVHFGAAPRVTTAAAAPTAATPIPPAATAAPTSAPVDATGATPSAATTTDVELPSGSASAGSTSPAPSGTHHTHHTSGTPAASAPPREKSWLDRRN